MKNLILFTILFFACAIGASAQDVCPQGQVCFSQADADRISTALAESKKKDKVIAAQDERARLQTELVKAKDDLLEQRLMTMKAQQETIVRLTAMKCSKSQFFIFIYRTKRCS